MTARPLVWTGCWCGVAWLLVLLTAGLSVTSDEGKTALCVALGLINLTGITVSALAWRRRECGAQLAASANVAAGLFTVLASIAVLSQ